jgi:polyisoprenoid-binding protein YceI
MKQLTLLAVCAFLSFSQIACNQAPQSDNAVTSDAQTVADLSSAEAQLAIDTQASKVEFVGTKPTGRHYGVLQITEGTVGLQDGQVVSGRYTIDLSSLKIVDEGMDEDSRGKLTGHLKSGDFFEVEKYPNATFEIVKVEPYNAQMATVRNDNLPESEFLLADPTHTVTGNLTLKEQTKSISFPARITTNGDEVNAKARFNIDRTNWGMNYRSESSLGDKIIHPTVNIGFDIVAKGNGQPM